MRLAVLMLTGLALMPACTELGAEGDKVARQAAKGVVNTVISNRFPGMNAAPLTDCIIDNADMTEVFQIAEAAVLGPTPATTNLITDIARRPETVRCAADNTLSSVLSGTG